MRPRDIRTAASANRPWTSRRWAGQRARGRFPRMPRNRRCALRSPCRGLLWDERRRGVIDDGSRAVGRQVVRAAQPLAEIGLDLADQLLGVALRGKLLDLVHAQALAVAVQALGLAETGRLFAVHDHA